MIDEETQQQLIDYVDGTLPDNERATLTERLAQEPELATYLEQIKTVSASMKRAAEWKPSPALRESFNALLNQEMANQDQGRVVSLMPTYYRVAAAVALLIVAGGIGFWTVDQWQERQEMAQLKKELQETKKMMMAMMNNELSPSQRMMGVSVANTLATTDDEITRALGRVLNEDPNSNVRLSALDALAKFSHEPAVRSMLIQSLSIQDDAVVQIALIQLLVRIRETGILPQLENIIDNQQSIKAVKDEAYTAKLKLS